MSEKIKVGITSEYIDKYGEFMVKGPGLKLLEAIPEVEYEIMPPIDFPEGLTEEEMVNYSMLWEIPKERVDGYDFIITMWSVWQEEVIKGNDRFVAMLRHGAGFDQCAVPAMAKNHSLVCTNSAGTRRPVAVATMTMLLALDTRLPLKMKMVKEGDWINKRYSEGYGLVGKTLGIIGLGNIGREILKLAQPFGMKHVAYDPYLTEADPTLNVELKSKEDVVKEADYLVLACAWNPGSEHMIGEKEFKMMKETSFIINVARGPIIDEKAMIRALETGQIRGAGIDVYEVEPTPVDNPLLHMDNVIATNHSLGWTEESFKGLWQGIVGQLIAIIHGEKPEGIVNQETWDDPEFQAKVKKLQERVGIESKAKA